MWAATAQRWWDGGGWRPGGGATSDSSPLPPAACPPACVALANCVPHAPFKKQDLGGPFVLKGWFAGYAWRGLETMMQARAGRLATAAA